MDITELDSLLASARQPETTVPLCLRGDLQADWEELDRQLSELRSQSTSTLGGAGTEEKALAEQIKALESRMTDATIQLRIRALPRRPWRLLLEQHPPREGNNIDLATGLNVETFWDALIEASIVEPELNSAQVQKLLDTLTSNQFDTVSTKAWDLNRRDVNVPFSSTASRIAASSGGTSKQPSDSASATSVSLAGNQKKSPSTRTAKTAS